MTPHPKGPDEVHKFLPHGIHTLYLLISTQQEENLSTEKQPVQGQLQIHPRKETIATGCHRGKCISGTVQEGGHINSLLGNSIVTFPRATPPEPKKPHNPRVSWHMQPQGGANWKAGRPRAQRPHNPPHTLCWGRSHSPSQKSSTSQAVGHDPLGDGHTSDLLHISSYEVAMK